MTLPIKRDLQRVHIVLSSKLLWTLDKVAETMSDEQRQSLAETVRILVEAHAARLGDVQKDGQDGSEFPVLIYPRTARFDNPASFESKLSDQLFNETRLDILIGGASVTGLGDSYNLLPSIPHALSSRVSEVTEDFIQYATTLVRAGGRNTFVAQLCHNYKIVQFARDYLSLHANHWKQLFETSLNQEWLRHLHVARQPLDRLFRPDASIDAERFSSLKAYCDLLDAVSRDGGFTPDSTLFLATWAVYDRFPLGSYDQKDSPLRKVKEGLTRFFSTLVDAYSHGRTPAEAVQASTREILTVIFNSLFKARYDVPALFSDVATDQQAVYADQFAVKIRETSGALAELLSSIDKTPDRPEKGSTEEAARLPGHPFFNADREPVLFLSGTAKKPVGHVDPDCAVRQKWLEKPRKNGLPTDPLTMDQIESAIGKDRRSVECCKGCHTPTWSQQQHYDDVKARFRYNSAASARLPTHLKSVV